MATHKKYNIAVKVGSYETNTGEVRNKYRTVGVVMEKDDGGRFILLDRTFNPAGVPADGKARDTVLLSLFENKPKQNNNNNENDAEAEQWQE